MRERVCPAEVTTPLPPPVAMPAGMVIEVSRQALDWIAAHLRREELLEQRIIDARGTCQ